MPGKALAGKVTWVVGGVGLIGKGICRGLLRAGSTVIVNSRSAERLSVLNDVCNPSHFTHHSQTPPCFTNTTGIPRILVSNPHVPPPSHCPTRRICRPRRHVA